MPSIHSSAIIECNGTSKIPATTHIEANTIISTGVKSSLILGERNTIYPGVIIRLQSGFIRTGNDISLGPGVIIYETRSGLTIGDNTMIAGGVKICGTSHGKEVTDIPMRFQATSSSPICIDDDVWIGMGVIIHPGVTIGKGSVIGSGSVVTKSIGEFMIAYGTPCKEIAARG